MTHRFSWLGLLMAGMVLALFSTAADCPPGNVITKMTSSMKAFQDALPLDYSTLKTGGAQLANKGKELHICLSNEVFPIAAMANSFVLPLTKKGQFILQLNFSNGAEAVKPGIYNPDAGYGKPFWVSAEIKVMVGEKGTIAMLGARLGTAEIVKMTETMVCGRFRLQAKAGEVVNSEVAGEFNVKLEKSRY
jgi:hypothetical protein